METPEFDLESDNMDMLSTVSYSDLWKKLQESSTSFMRLFDHHKDRLQTSAAKFNEIADIVRETYQGTHKPKKGQSLCGAVGGAVAGAGVGAASGALGGAFGAAGGVVCRKVFANIGAVGAIGGFVGGSIGGSVGGTVVGALGGAVGGAVIATGGSIDSAAMNVVCSAVGCLVGGTIGGIFGGDVGTVGGAVGGAFGAFCGAGVAVGTVAGVANQFIKAKACTGITELNEVKTIQRTGVDFRETIEPFVEELKTIKRTCDMLHEMSFSVIMQSVAGQSMNALAAVGRMKKTLTDIDFYKDDAQLVTARTDESAKQCQQTIEEFKKMRAELGILLVPLRI